MNKGFNKVAQAGFTLIELIVVIVILGILAATALPKFASFTGDARAAALQGAKGSVAAASAMTHGRWLIANADTIAVEGHNIAMVNGYPSAVGILVAAGIEETDFQISPAATSVTIRPRNLPAARNDTCRLIYTQSAAAGAAPDIDLEAGTCE